MSYTSGSHVMSSMEPAGLYGGIWEGVMVFKLLSYVKDYAQFTTSFFVFNVCTLFF